MPTATAGLSDEQLMEAVKAGDLRQMEGLFSRYHGAIYNFLYRLSWNRELCEDLTQTVFYRVLKYRHSYQAGKPVRAWLYQVARNLYYDQAREAAVLYTDAERLMAMSDADGGSEESQEKEQQQLALQEALARLPEKKRELLVLAKYQGMAHQEIAELTGMSLAAVKVTVHRAMKELRELFFAVNS